MILYYKVHYIAQMLDVLKNIYTFVSKVKYIAL